MKFGASLITKAKDISKLSLSFSFDLDVSVS